ncbi:MAG: hypothetical protein JW913_01900 [Chitinispirillaceae bacterium]|nr:hypothetical protein [Chitinispirillaceae bacterium]
MSKSVLLSNSFKIESESPMPLAKRPTKKALMKSNKCPWCGSRKFEEAKKLNILDRIRYIGCTVWTCGKCGKKWGG